MFGLLLVWSVSARADEPTAPLENAKAELQALRKDEKTAKAGAMDASLKDGLPQFHAPTPGALPLELPQQKTPQAEMKKQRDAQKNWLLDGVGRLDAEARSRANGQGRPARDESEIADEDANSAESATLLRVYADQKKKEGAAKNVRDAEKKNDVLSQNDAFAPFLQDWLADSPVRGKFFDDFLKNPGSRLGELSRREGPAGAVENSPSSGLTITTPSGGRAPTTGAEIGGPKPNPYLEALTLGEMRGAAVAAKAAEPVSKFLGNKATVPAVELPLPARNGDRKAPPSPFDNSGFFRKKNF